MSGKDFLMFESPYGPPFSPINAEQRVELIALIQKNGLEALQDPIIEMARNSVALEPSVEQTFTVGCSRLGGLPDVPPDWTWPNKLVFLGQLNMAEIAPHDDNHLLPERGLLSFFHFPDTYGNGLGFPHRVYFFEDLDNLMVASAPPNYRPVAETNEYCVYNPLRVEPRAAVSLPPFYSRGWSEIAEMEDDSSLAEDNYPGLLRDLRPYGRGHRLLGHHSFMDGDADEDAWKYSDRTADDSLQDWVLLFQMVSDYEIGAEFWRFGLAYFMIRRQDLAIRRFDRTYSG